MNMILCPSVYLKKNVNVFIIVLELFYPVCIITKLYKIALSRLPNCCFTYITFLL